MRAKPGYISLLLLFSDPPELSVSAGVALSDWSGCGGAGADTP